MAMSSQSSLPLSYRSQSDRILENFYHNNRLKDSTKQVHQNIVIDLVERFHTLFNSRPIIKLFGSSVNGFGAEGCDLDMSVSFQYQSMFHNHPLPTSVEELSRALDRNPNVIEKQFIPAAVPIIKFKYRYRNYSPYSKDYDCDMSFGNDLAVVNSELLAAYSRIDVAVPIIGLLVKTWAKKSNICGHPQPSSYTWTLMVIHYLQKVGVLPYLQEVGPKMERIIDGKNVHFYRNILFIQRFYYNRNYESLTKLFIGFFEYFAKYNYHYPITIRDVAGEVNPSGLIYVRDPFIGSKNLTENLSEQGFRAIRLNFILATVKLLPTRQGQITGDRIIDFIS